MERTSRSACGVLMTRGQGDWAFCRGFQLGMWRHAVATTDAGSSRLVFAVRSAVACPVMLFHIHPLTACTPCCLL